VGNHQDSESVRFSQLSGRGSGIVVDVVVNDRAEHAQVWVEKADRTLSFPPCDLVFR